MRYDTSSRRSRAHLATGAIAAAALMAGASTAAALIVPGRSVAGIRLNDTAAKVRKTLGPLLMRMALGSVSSGSRTFET